MKVDVIDIERSNDEELWILEIRLYPPKQVEANKYWQVSHIISNMQMNGMRSMGGLFAETFRQLGEDFLEGLGGICPNLRPNKEK